MSKKLAHVLIGAPASGKSTWSKKIIQQFIQEGEDVAYISGDEIRKEIFGDLNNRSIYTKENHQKVFTLASKRLQKSIGVQNIIYDATNLSRKRRAPLFEYLSNCGYTVVAVVFIEPLWKLLQRNKNREVVVPDDKVRSMYLSLEIPRVGVDCDKIRVESTTPFFNRFPDFVGCCLEYTPCLEIFSYLNSDWIKEVGTEPYLSHDSPHHLESIGEHIDMCVKESLNNQDFTERNILFKTALFHDLGKYVTKVGGRYLSHENVSAQYSLLASTYPDVIIEDYVHELIKWHMLAHQGLSQKVIQANNMKEEFVRLLLKFKKIDEKSRLV